MTANCSPQQGPAKSFCHQNWCVCEIVNDTCPVRCWSKHTQTTVRDETDIRDANSWQISFLGLEAQIQGLVWVSIWTVVIRLAKQWQRLSTSRLRGFTDNATGSGGAALATRRRWRLLRRAGPQPSLRVPGNFNGFRVFGSVTARHSSSGR